MASNAATSSRAVDVGHHTSPSTDGNTGRQSTPKRVIVTTVLEPPYMMLKEHGRFLTGNDRCEMQKTPASELLFSIIGVSRVGGQRTQLLTQINEVDLMG